MNPWPHCWRRFFWGNSVLCEPQGRYRPVLECLEDRSLPSGGFTQLNLASDLLGAARVTDPNLVNPWGVSFSPTGPFWFADNGSGLSELVDGRGQQAPLALLPPTVPVGATPTGVVFNDGSGFRISENGVSAPSRFLFATEDGTITGWSGVVDLSQAILAVDNASVGAVYKGLALATGPAGRSFLYAADFGRGAVDVFDQDFKPFVQPGSFEDPNLPNGYAPFNIQNINNLLFVTYAPRDSARPDDIAGAGHGFIDVFNTGGNLVRRFASQGPLNSPWGLALAPASFGPFGGALLVGNNGDGHINAYDPKSGVFLGPLADDTGIPITIPSLWALTLGNGHEGGTSDTLFFTAGLDDEAHGLFGAIQAPQQRGADTAGSGIFDPHAPGEPGDYPLPPSGGPALQEADGPSGAATAALLPLTESSLALIPTLSTVPQLGAQVEAPAVATLVRALSFPAYARTALPLSNPGSFPPQAVDSPPLENAGNNSLGLSVLFNLNAAPAWSDHPIPWQSPETNRGLVDTRWPSSGDGSARADGLFAGPYLEDLQARSNVEQGSESYPASGRADKVLAQVPSEGRPPSAGERRAESKAFTSHDRGSWTRLLSSLLVVVGIPVISALCRRHRAGSLSHPGRMPELAWREGITGPPSSASRSCSASKLSSSWTHD
jgi:uncharacterized protein (TIGR03118 family)